MNVASKLRLPFKFGAPQGDNGIVVQLGVTEVLNFKLDVNEHIMSNVQRVS
jgi:hypothetical protein